jgi:hypothetical protein
MAPDAAGSDSRVIVGRPPDRLVGAVGGREIPIATPTFEDLSEFDKRIGTRDLAPIEKMM